jgi:glycine amidinotransferase
MSWRNRYFEREAYYELFKEYFDKGARWVSAPRPPLKDSLYNTKYKIPKENEPVQYVINESEIVFDAADFIRCGKDIFVTLGNVTNKAGVEWLRRHIGDSFNIHMVKTRSRQPMHIDTTMVPLGPGKMLINPKYLDKNDLPEILKTWEILEAPYPLSVKGGIFNENATMCSLWLNMNILMLDEKKVIVESSQTPMITALKTWGFEPIPCNMNALGPFGGAFHCVTLDIRRKGNLQSYF